LQRILYLCRQYSKVCEAKPDALPEWRAFSS